MKKIILYGSGSFARLIKWYIDNDDEREIVAVTVEKKYVDSATFEGLPVLPFEKITEKFLPGEFEILLGIGYTHMNDVRKRIFRECKEKGYTIAQYIHSSVRLSGVQLGEGNIILEETVIQPFVKIGSGNLIWCNATIAHDCKIGDFNTISVTASLSGFSELGNNCFIGNGAVTRDGVKVEDYTLVGAAAYVSRNTAQNSVVAANKGVVLLNKSSKDFL